MTRGNMVASRGDEQSQEDTGLVAPNSRRSTTNSSLSQGKYITKWVVPAAWLVFSFFCQSVCLHVGTYYYVMWMERLRDRLDDAQPESAALRQLQERLDETNPESAAALRQLDIAEDLSTSLRNGALHDVVADLLGRQPVPTAAMDAICALIPAAWAVLALHQRDLHVWSKCLFCAGLLAHGKGFLAWITVVPDSIGWEGCKARLGEEGVDYFRKLGNLNFEDHFFSSWASIVQLEVVGFNGHRLRFCGDMVYSGHTYFVGLFAVGLYDLVKKITQDHKQRKQFLIRCVASVSLTAIVILEGCMLLANRFHYSIDVLIALWAVFLLYTNAAIAIVIEWWCDRLWLPHEEKVLRKCPECNRIRVEDDDQGEILIPPCFPPFCLIEGRYYIHHCPKDDPELLP
eukprot:gnl/MRDRNA2_/MRDRNA2_28442_c0_seq1.p1 gnl/MRDRNA2_/MRDRNA2_28442_c0~~gnl/MRDRNA2_/MRDRNA2_28442_c0_seq1.p1  ORF type:complete len:401 (-),score=51.28 gnl/MRDRNA2_/MRDRNA2_28442_c0_seq1:216-1418(-)